MDRMEERSSLKDLRELLRPVYVSVIKLLKSPSTWLALGTVAALGWWWSHLTPFMSNVTLAVVVVSLTLFVFFSRILAAQARLTRVLCTAGTFVLLGGIAYFLRQHPAPPSKTTAQIRADLIAELTTAGQKKDWDAIAKRLPTFEGEPAFRDIGLYFRGLLYSNARPAPDPEQYLSQVPQESQLFIQAQWLRLHNWSATPNEQLANAIMSSLDKASRRNPIYYRLRLNSGNLSYNEIAAMYQEFVERYRYVFDFAQFKHVIQAQIGVYMEVEVNESFEIPACVLLFLARLIETSHKECIEDRKRAAVAQYTALVTNYSNLDFSLGLLGIDPHIKEYLDQLSKEPLPTECGPH